MTGKTGIFDYAWGQLLIAIIMVLLCFACCWRIIRNNYEYENGFVLLFVVLLLVISLLIGSLISTNGDLPNRADLPTYVSIVLAALLTISEGEAKEFKTAVAASLGACSAGALVLFVVWPAYSSTNFSSLSFASVDAGRLTGPFLHPNAIGSLMCVGFVFCLIYISGWKRLLSVGLLLSVIVLSDQRGALIVCLASLIVLVFWKRDHSIYSWLASTLGMLALAAFLVLGGSRSVVNLFNRREESLSDRSDVANFVFEHLDTILPWGIGPNGLYSWTLSSGFGFGFAHAHNSWLSMLVAGGLMAAGIFLFVSLFSIVRTGRAAVPSDLAAVVGVLVLSLVESPIFAGSNWSLVPVAVLALYILFDGVVTPSLSPVSDGPMSSVRRKTAKLRA